MTPNAGAQAKVDESTLLPALRAGDERAFQRLTERYRPELLVHCYRMLGSFHDAEDVLQETLLRAWRGLESFKGRSALRLRDPAYFAEVRVDPEAATIAWPNGVDMAPEPLYEEAQHYPLREA